LNGAAAVGIGIGAREVGEDMSEICLRSLHAYAVVEARNGLQPMAAACLHPRCGVEVNWCVDGIACVEGITKARRHDTDDRVGAAVETHGLAHNVASAVEVLRPGFVT
jgi:hypothetical protein